MVKEKDEKGKDDKENDKMENILILTIKQWETNYMIYKKKFRVYLR